jgi:hypothetical protein
VLSEGEIKVSDKVTLEHVALVQSLGLICFLFPSYWMRVLRCFNLVVLRFWILERSSLHGRSRGSSFLSRFLLDFWCGLLFFDWFFV